MSACNLRHHRARHKGFHDNSPLGLVTPATPASRPNTDIDPTSRLRSVIYMVDHMCEPICQSRFASCGSSHALQGGSRVPLTNELASPAARRPASARGSHRLKYAPQWWSTRQPPTPRRRKPPRPAEPIGPICDLRGLVPRLLRIQKAVPKIGSTCQFSRDFLGR